MKAILFVLAACILALAYGQAASSQGGGASSSSMSGFGGGINNQVLYMAALGGNDNARLMLQCSMFNIPLFLCMRTMA